MPYTLKNDVSAIPLNCNVGYNNSWIHVQNNANRELFSQASYITNFDDLSISLSAADLNIGSVHLQDPDSGLQADVVPVGAGLGALRVISQDLESSEDDVTIGDRLGNFASIYSPLSALKVYNTNPISSIEISNILYVKASSTFPVSGSVTILNPVTSVSISNQLTGITVLNPVTSVSISNPVTSVSISNQLTGITVLNQLTGITVLNPVTSVSISNPVTGITILNPVTSVSISNQLTGITVLNQLTGITVLNPVTAVNVLNAITAKVDTSTGFPINFADNATVDAFQRLRISEPVTLFDSKQLHQMSTMFWSNTSQNGNIYHTGDSDPSITLTTNANNGYAIRQTTQRFNYQSGKSMLYMFTGTLNPETNITKRYGCFSSLTATPFTPNVGLYFEASNNTIHCVQNNTGFLVPSVSASRNEWNIDKLDGTGPSGQIITLSGTNIFVIDYEWLGVGRVRYGVVLDGQVWYCHKINNTGKAGAYLRSPNHPIRAELRQTGTGSGSMKMICSTVISEGGSDFSGVTRSIDTVSNTVGAGVRRAILGVRLQYNKLDSVNQIINAGVICMQQAASNQAPYKYEIVLTPAGVTGGTWTDITESNFQRWRGNVTPTSDTGFVLATGFGSAGAGIDLGTFNLKKFLRIGSTVHGVRDELYLVVTPLAANDGVYGSLSFIESD